MSNVVSVNTLLLPHVHSLEIDGQIWIFGKDDRRWGDSTFDFYAYRRFPNFYYSTKNLRFLFNMVRARIEMDGNENNRDTAQSNKDV